MPPHGDIDEVKGPSSRLKKEAGARTSFSGLLSQLDDLSEVTTKKKSGDSTSSLASSVSHSAAYSSRSPVIERHSNSVAQRKRENERDKWKEIEMLIPNNNSKSMSNTKDVRLSLSSILRGHNSPERRNIDNSSTFNDMANNDIMSEGDHRSQGEVGTNTANVRSDSLQGRSGNPLTNDKSKTQIPDSPARSSKEITSSETPQEIKAPARRVSSSEKDGPKSAPSGKKGSFRYSNGGDSGGESPQSANRSYENTKNKEEPQSWGYVPERKSSWGFQEKRPPTGSDKDKQEAPTTRRLYQTSMSNLNRIHIPDTNSARKSGSMPSKNESPEPRGKLETAASKLSGISESMTSSSISESKNDSLTTSDSKESSRETDKSSRTGSPEVKEMNKISSTGSPEVKEMNKISSAGSPEVKEMHKIPSAGSPEVKEMHKIPSAGSPEVKEMHKIPSAGSPEVKEMHKFSSTGSSEVKEMHKFSSTGSSEVKEMHKISSTGSSEVKEMHKFSSTEPPKAKEKTEISPDNLARTPSKENMRKMSPSALKNNVANGGDSEKTTASSASSSSGITNPGSGVTNSLNSKESNSAGKQQASANLKKSTSFPTEKSTNSSSSGKEDTSEFKAYSQQRKYTLDTAEPDQSSPLEIITSDEKSENCFLLMGQPDVSDKLYSENEPEFFKKLLNIFKGNKFTKEFSLFNMSEASMDTVETMYKSALEDTRGFVILDQKTYDYLKKKILDACMEVVDLRKNYNTAYKNREVTIEAYLNSKEDFSKTALSKKLRSQTQELSNIAGQMLKLTDNLASAEIDVFCHLCAFLRYIVCKDDNKNLRINTGQVSMSKFEREIKALKKIFIDDKSAENIGIDRLSLYISCLEKILCTLGPQSAETTREEISRDNYKEEKTPLTDNGSSTTNAQDLTARMSDRNSELNSAKPLSANTREKFSAYKDDELLKESSNAQEEKLCAALDKAKEILNSVNKTCPVNADLLNILDSIHDTVNSNLKELTETRDFLLEEEAKVGSLQDTIKSIQASNLKEVSSLKEDNDKDINVIKEQHETEINSIKETLQHENRILLDKIEEMKKYQEELEGKIKASESTQRDIEGSNQKALSTLKAQIEHLTQSLSEKDETLAKSGKQLESCKKESNNLNQEIERIKSEKKAMEKEIIALEEKQKQQLEELESFRSNSKGIKEYSLQENQNIERLKDLEAQLQSTKENNTQLSERLKTANSKVESLEMDLATCRGNFFELKIQSSESNDAFQAKLRDSSTETKNLKAESDKMKSKNEKLEKSISDKELKIKDIQDKLNKEKEKVKELTAEKTKAAQNIKSLENEIKQLTKILMEQKERNASILEEMDNVKLQEFELSEKLKALEGVQGDKPKELEEPENK